MSCDPSQIHKSRDKFKLSCHMDRHSVSILQCMSFNRHWYNKELKITSNSACNNNLLSIGIWYVEDLFEGRNFPFYTWRQRGA